MADKNQELGKIDDREAWKQHLTSLLFELFAHEVLEIMRRSDKLNFMTFFTYVVLNLTCPFSQAQIKTCWR